MDKEIVALKSYSTHIFQLDSNRRFRLLDQVGKVKFPEKEEEEHLCDCDYCGFYDEE